MRPLLPLLLVPACTDLPSDPQPPPPCTEILDTLASNERSPWGTTPNGVRVLLGEPATATVDGAALTVQPGWPAGFVAAIWSEPDAAPDPRPPLWCTDRLELPATVALQADDGRFDVDGAPAEALGVMRAEGTWDVLEAGFVGRLPGTALPDLAPDGADPAASEVAVWLRWVEGEGVAHVEGSLRWVPAEADELTAGEVVATIEVP